MIDPAREFQKHAQLCQRMARETVSQEGKAAWRRLAERWQRCAEEASRTGVPLMRPVWLEFPEAVIGVQNSLLIHLNRELLFDPVPGGATHLLELGIRSSLHIEQGGILDTEKIDIGVVEGIVGINWWDVTIEGFANHAGTTAMNNRQDALLAAAKFIEAVNRVATSVPGRQVGTVGRIQALPGAPNVIPGKVILSLELRDLNAEKIDMLYQKIRTEADQIATANKVKFDFKEINVNTPAPTDPRIRALIDQSAKELALSTKQMPSGAGHDAQDMARLAPVGMIFIPSVGGISHSPKEFSRPQDIANGANVLLQALLKVDQTKLS